MMLQFISDTLYNHSPR